MIYLTVGVCVVLLGLEELDWSEGTGPGEGSLVGGEYQNKLELERRRRVRRRPASRLQPTQALRPIALPLSRPTGVSSQDATQVLPYN